MEAIIQLFNKHALRPSPQRMAVMKFLLGHPTHPTAETIYTALFPSYPTLSRTTVYQTLEKLYETGLAQKIVIEDGEMRFDADTSDHGHFKCVTCEEVFDFFYPANHPFPKMEGAFEIQEQHLYYKGLCPTCKSTRDAHVTQPCKPRSQGEHHDHDPSFLHLYNDRDDCCPHDRHQQGGD